MQYWYLEYLHHVHVISRVKFNVASKLYELLMDKSFKFPLNCMISKALQKVGKTKTACSMHISVCSVFPILILCLLKSWNNALWTESKMWQENEDINFQYFCSCTEHSLEYGDKQKLYVIYIEIYMSEISRNYFLFSVSEVHESTCRTGNFRSLERLIITAVCQGVAMLKHKCMNHNVLMEAICNWAAGLQTLFDSFFALLAVIVISKWFKNLMLYKLVMKMDSTSLHIQG